MNALFFCVWVVILMSLIGCTANHALHIADNVFLSRAEQTLDSLYTYYGVKGTCLLRENYPPEVDYSTVGLHPEIFSNLPRPYSSLWPYSGTFSSVCALLEATRDIRYADMLECRVLPGLYEYYDKSRMPGGYASYIQEVPNAERFYDDNIWLGIHFMEAYCFTKKKEYLQEALHIWHFVESGMDSVLDGGIYWCEQKKDSKNTCSSAAGSVLALKLFIATGDILYLDQGKSLYHWTQEHLQDSTDYLYFDHLTLDGKVCKAKYAYNSGLMMLSAVLLYQITGEQCYLVDAQRVAESCYQYFFSEFSSDCDSSFRLLKGGDIWFTAIMLRGFIALYKTDGNGIYLACFRSNLDYAWQHARGRNGLFSADFSGRIKDKRKWLLTQAAMVEMYARMAAFQ